MCDSVEYIVRVVSQIRIVAESVSTYKFKDVIRKVT